MDRGATSEAGVTLVEVVIGLAIAAVLMIMAVQGTTRMSGVQRANEHNSRLQLHARRALKAIVNDLRRSLYRTTPGAELPYVFDDGVAVAPHASHAHTPAQSEALPTDSDFGPNREIIFVLPLDANGDGRPDLAANAIVWAPDKFSYTVLTDAAGNALVRSVNNASRAVVARHIERIVFDTPATSGFTIPLGTVRVRLFLRSRDEKGVLYRHQAESLVRLQQEST